MADEFDIYDDLDVFEGNEKQQKECADCAELRVKLNAAEEDLKRLHDELNESKKSNETQLANNCSLLTTAREEIQRKDARIRDLQKEKDDICFRRKKPGRAPTKDTCTQSTITCKPFICYELKRVIDETHDRPSERNHNRDERDIRNPFASKLKENNEHKVDHKNGDKNAGHRHKMHQQDEYNNSRGKRNCQRSRPNERHEQLNVDRQKRKRSRSLSKERKRARRTRSRSRSRREREKNGHERSSPNKTMRTQPLLEKSKSSVEKSRRENLQRRSPERTSDDLRSKLRLKRESAETDPQRQHTREKLEPEEKPTTNPVLEPTECTENGSEPMDIDNTIGDKRNLNHESGHFENMPVTKEIPTGVVQGDNDLEEGEIDDEVVQDSIQADLNNAKCLEEVIPIENPSLGQPDMSENHSDKDDSSSRVPPQAEKVPEIAITSPGPLPHINENIDPSELNHNKQLIELIQDKSLQSLESVLNTSRNRSIKNVSTSSRDYLYVEDDNNETIIYITRKKKKKKDKKEKKSV